ncbi:cell surface protein [Methanosarcina horonobensis HB-1 = JCM 15518]|uniref:Cell surface protein n=2 Tax=Methanosarcina horonobensis TaxID=418008 RepID=A0A0E3SGE7_9EURY|nr:cell surface protein [Methanosarcina horonobensis HB-1 = JCM 15518]
MQNNYSGTANVSFNGMTLGNETLNVPFHFIVDGGNDGEAYVQVNDHVNRVTSDYMMYYNVTSLIEAGENTAVVSTAPLDSSFDGRIKLITLVVAYNDGSGNKIWYQINRGHDADTYYVEDYQGETYVGSTDFEADLPEDSSLVDAELTVVHMASTDGAYTFNGNNLASGTSQGTYCGSDAWDVKDYLESTGKNTLTYDRNAAFYKCALGILTTEYTTSSSGDPGDNTSNETSGNSGEMSSTDLSVQTVKISHNGFARAWDNLNNTVSVTVINNGPEKADSFDIELYSDGILIESKQVPGLANGATETVDFLWKPEEIKDYILRAVISPGSTMSDTDAKNNALSKTQEVLHNGYVGDNPLETYAHGMVKGNVIYDYGNSSYSSKVFSGDTYGVSHSLELPEGATVKFARLYNFWTWSATDTTGVIPSMSLQFEGSPLTPEAEYEDQKGWGSQYDYPTGTWAYDVTGLVTGSGTYTTVVTNTHSDNGNFVCFDGIALLVVYEDSSGEEIEYWINEGCDMVSTMSTSGGLTPEEATVEIPFEGSIDLSSVDEARLWTTVQSGGHVGISLEFNEMNTSGIYDSTPYSDLDIDEARSVETYLLAENNRARIIPPLVTDNNGDYLAPSNAILVISYKDGATVTPALSLSASTLNVTVGEEIDVTYTVTSDDSPVEGTLVNLSGCATGSGTTDVNGTVVLEVNASSKGAITAEASKDGYTRAKLTQQAVESSSSGSGSPATVSLEVNLIPAVSLTVSPNSLYFGTVSLGTPSESLPLTLQNNGDTSMKVTAEVDDQEAGPFETGLLLDNSIWSSYSKVIAAESSVTSEAQLALPANYPSTGQFRGSLLFWAEAA